VSAAQIAADLRAEYEQWLPEVDLYVARLATDKRHMLDASIEAVRADFALTLPPCSV
jgi:hypothetical protein